MKKNRFEVRTTVALTEDFPFYGLCRNDIAEIQNIHEHGSGQVELLLSVVNALGDTIAVFTVTGSQIRELRSDEVLHVRSHQSAALAEPSRKYRTE